MPFRCAYTKCPSDTAFLNQSSTIKLHQVPRSDRGFVIKMFNIQKTDLTRIKLCSIHFREDAFLRTGQRCYLRKDIVFRDFLVPPGPPSDATADESYLDTDDELPEDESSGGGGGGQLWAFMLLGEKSWFNLFFVKFFRQRYRCGQAASGLRERCQEDQAS